MKKKWQTSEKSKKKLQTIEIKIQWKFKWQNVTNYKNYTEFCIENYFLRKITQPYQHNSQIFS